MSDPKYEAPVVSAVAFGSRAWSYEASSHGSRVMPHPQVSRRLADSATLNVPEEEVGNFEGHLLSDSDVCDKENFEAGDIGRAMQCLCEPMLEHFDCLLGFLRDFLLHHSPFGSLL